MLGAMGIHRCLALLVVARIAAADDNALPTDKVQGFVAPGTGELSGRVVDADGNPIKRATVHVVTKDGDQVVTTGDDGAYRVKVRDQMTLFFVHGDAQISGTAVTSQVVADQETIQVKDALPPAKLAQAISDPRVIPEYTMEMMDKNAWVRAWLLVEVSDTGVVSRVKLLNAPGYDLDAIAIRDAFKLKFEAARDRADKPIRSQVLWAFEWPAFWWMKDNGHARRKMPAEAYRVRCRGAGPTMRGVYRDCSPANLVNVIKAKWIDRPRK
jgi:hypothetical protein